MKESLDILRLTQKLFRNAPCRDYILITELLFVSNNEVNKRLYIIGVHNLTLIALANLCNFR